MRGGSFYHWLGASADADPATHEPSLATRLGPTGECRLRYQFGEVPMSNSYAAVFDNDRRGEVFCLIDPSDCVGGMKGAMARAKDIAIAFNRLSK